MRVGESVAGRTGWGEWEVWVGWGGPEVVVVVGGLVSESVGGGKMASF